MLYLELIGTGPSGGFPVAGCPCARCSHSAPPARRPAQLLIGGRLLLDVEGRGHPVTMLGSDEAGVPRVEHLPGPASGSAAVLVRVPGHRPLLWAPQAGSLPAAALDVLAGARLGAAFIGPAPETDPAGLQGDPSRLHCARTLARLRANGAVDATTRCVIVGLGHRQGSPQRLALALAAWGATAPADGCRLTVHPSSAETPSDKPGGPGLTGRTLVLGGASSGKSALAEDLVSAEPEVLYAATGPAPDPDDDREWALRIRRHRERRPSWWRTEETHAVAGLLIGTARPILLDSVGTWLAGALDRAGAWDDRAGWREALAGECDELVRAWRARRAPLVAVSEEVGLGVVPATAAGRLFRDELGRLNRQLADESEQVLVVVAGQLLTTGPGPW